MIWTNNYCWFQWHILVCGEKNLNSICCNIWQCYKDPGFFTQRRSMPTQWYLNSCCETGKWEESLMQNRNIESRTFDSRVHFVVTFANYANDFLRWSLLALASCIIKCQALLDPTLHRIEIGLRQWNEIVHIFIRQRRIEAITVLLGPFFHLHPSFFGCIFFYYKQNPVSYSYIILEKWFNILIILKAFNLWLCETTLLFYERVKVKYLNQVDIVPTAYYWILLMFERIHKDIFRNMKRNILGFLVLQCFCKHYICFIKR